MSRLKHFQLLSEAEIAHSPSRRDGMGAEIEANRRRFAARMMYETGHVYKMSVTTPAIAVSFFLRFFTCKSMKRNDPFIIAAGALFLAGKVNDEPRPVQHLSVELLKRWYGRDNPMMRHKLLDQAFVENLFSAALDAERAIMYTLGFDFNVDVPHYHISTLLRLPRFLYLKENNMFHQYAINFCNDIMRKDGTMVLQYTSREITLAVFYYIFKAAKKENLEQITLPPPEQDGVHWYVKEGLDPLYCKDIMRRITSLYHASGRTGATTSSQPAASAATTVLHPGASACTTVGGGYGALSDSTAPAVSIAGSGGTALQDTAGGRADSSTAQMPSPVSTSKVPAAAGQKRRLDSPGASEVPVSKATRHAPEGGGIHVQLQPAGAVAPPAAAAVPPMPATVSLAAAAPAPAGDSEPEEGEIEEGELAA